MTLLFKPVGMLKQHKQTPPPSPADKTKQDVTSFTDSPIRVRNSELWGSECCAGKVPALSRDIAHVLKLRTHHLSVWSALRRLLLLFHTSVNVQHQGQDLKRVFKSKAADQQHVRASSHGNADVQKMLRWPCPCWLPDTAGHWEWNVCFFWHVSDFLFARPPQM